MTIRQRTCYIAECDLCGETETVDCYTPHMPSEQSALDHVTNHPSGLPENSWTLTPDGQLVCTDMEDQAHREIHEAAGKTITGCAMTVTFG